MARTFAHPLQTLREKISALEAAITQTLANPKKEPVHHLRTSTRRIEAQLELLSLIPRLPDHAKPARTIRKLLKRLRRAAGAVRDLDVQSHLVLHHRDVHEQQNQSSASNEMRNQAGKLQRKLKRRRCKAALNLLKVLKTEQQNLDRALNRLLEALSSAEDLRVPSIQLAQLTRDWYQRNTHFARSATDSDTLHNLRESAKLARYIAENGAGKLAHTFESLQQTGGAWHDLLTLAHTAKKHLGAHSPLTQSFVLDRDRALDVYRQALLR